MRLAFACRCETSPVLSSGNFVCEALEQALLVIVFVISFVKTLFTGNCYHLICRLPVLYLWPFFLHLAAF